MAEIQNSPLEATGSRITVHLTQRERIALKMQAAAGSTTMTALARLAIVRQLPKKRDRNVRS